MDLGKFLIIINNLKSSINEMDLIKENLKTMLSEEMYVQLNRKINLKKSQLIL